MYDVANYFKGEVAAGLRVAPANDEYTSVLYNVSTNEKCSLRLTNPKNDIDD